MTSYSADAQDQGVKKVVIEKKSPVKRQVKNAVIFIKGYGPADTIRKPSLKLQDIPEGIRPGQGVLRFPRKSAGTVSEFDRSKEMIFLDGSPSEAAEWIGRYMDQLDNETPNTVQTEDVQVQTVQLRPSGKHSSDKDSVVFLDLEYKSIQGNIKRTTPESLMPKVTPGDRVIALPASEGKEDQNSIKEIRINNPESEMVPMSVEESESESTVNLPPVAVPDVFTTPKGQPLIVEAPGHLANDYDLNNDPLSWTSFQVPSNGTISDASTDGSFTYTPNPGFSGIDSFVITITDGNGNSASGQIAILVEDNASPVAVPDVYTTAQGEALIVTDPGHLINDFDPDGDPVLWTSFVSPENGTISEAAVNGTFTYTPDPGFSGIDSFVISITDGNGNFSNGLVIVLVEENRAPVAIPDVFTTNQGEPLMVNSPGHLGNDYDLEGDPLTWLSFVSPENGAISNAAIDGSFTYTPDPGFFGQDSFDVTISDGQGNVTVGQITITVIPSGQRPPVVIADAYVTNENEALIVPGSGHLSNDYDPDGDPLTWLSFVSPENGAISSPTIDGSFTYTPDPGFTGQDSFEVSISDGNGNITSGKVVISVVPMTGSGPVAIGDVFTTNQDQPLIVSPPGHLANDYDPDDDPLTWV